MSHEYVSVLAIPPMGLAELLSSLGPPIGAVVAANRSGIWWRMWELAAIALAVIAGYNHEWQFTKFFLGLGGAEAPGADGAGGSGFPSSQSLFAIHVIALLSCLHLAGTACQLPDRIASSNLRRRVVSTASGGGRSLSGVRHRVKSKLLLSIHFLTFVPMPDLIPGARLDRPSYPRALTAP